MAVREASPERGIIKKPFGSLKIHEKCYEQQLITKQAIFFPFLNIPIGIVTPLFERNQRRMASQMLVNITEMTRP